MSLFRHSEPQALRYVWNAIEVIRGQRQIANISRITKIIQKEHSYTPKEILHHLHRAVKDNMVVETISLGCKGSKAGKEQEGYWIPEDLHMLDVEATHDWYCFKCHKPGDMVKCCNCVVAFHLECIEEAFRPKTPVNVGGDHYCKYCQLKRATITENSVTAREELNRCLGFISKSALDTAPELATQPSPKDYTQFDYFIKQPQDLNSIIDACERNEFEVVSEFVQKTELILHNCVILHGEKHAATEAAKRMLEMCSRELKELSLCKNCYLQSNTKPGKDWFCTPCSPPHKILWARQRGFGYWPAKVIQVDDAAGKVDVRYFGGYHERAWVGFDNIGSIVLSPAQLNIKKTKRWLIASEEMKEYVIQAEKKFGSEKATSVVNLNFRFSRLTDDDHEEEKETTKDEEIPEMKIRGAKRRRELSLMLRAAKKRRLSKAAANVDVTGPENGKQPDCSGNSEPVIDVTTVNDQPNESHKKGKSHRVTRGTRQLKIFGQKAILEEECARTWPYATELIKAGLFQKAYKQKELKAKKINDRTVIPVKVDCSSQTEQNEMVNLQQQRPATCGKLDSKPKTNECDCKRRYEGVLIQYKACIRRVRNREKNEILASCALMIKKKLGEAEEKQQLLQSEIIRLKKENEMLRKKVGGE